MQTAGGPPVYAARMKKSLLSLIAITAAGACGCGPSGEEGCSAVVSPGATADENHAAIQTALANAKSGAVVCLRPGTWSVQDELSIAVDNLTLRSTGSGSDGRATLDFAGQTHGANGISAVSVSGFTIKNLTVKNTPGDAVRVTQSDHVTFDHVTVTWDAGRATANGAYGLYPVQSSHVLVDGCTVSYASDAGLYVGQSDHVLVRNSEAFGNVAGIEFENTTDAEAVGNYAHDNTGGLLVFNLPNLKVQDGKRTKVHGNRVENNNGENFAAKSGIVHIVPSGTGVLVMAADNNEITDNDISGNQSVGVAVISYYITQQTYMDAMYDPFPEGNYVHDNRMSGDGKMPDGLAYNITLALSDKTHVYTTVEELIWDGVADPAKMNTDGSLTNCFLQNGIASYRNLGVDVKSLMMGVINFNSTTDGLPVTCKHDALPTITP